jgi:hypothetical protein
MLQADRQQDSGLKTLLAEQARLKRAIKAEKENTVMAATPAASTVRSRHHLAATSSATTVTGGLREIEEKLEEIVLQMEGNRSRQGRPYDLLLMTMEQICEEKAEMQALLLGELTHPHLAIIRCIQQIL